MDVELILLLIFAAMCALLVAVILLWRETKAHRSETRDLNLTATALINTLDTMIELRYPAPPLTERSDIGI